MSTDEGALRNQRIEFARENVKGVFPTEPAFEFFSDNMNSVEWSPSPGVQERRGLGGPDISGFFNGPEEHEFTVSYDLQRFVADASGNPVDPAGDGILRDSNNDLPNTHSLLIREENYEVPEDETVDGENGPKDTRLYLVGVGGRVSSVTLSGDPGSQQPITVELSYSFQKVREYQFDQPDTSTDLELVSTDDADTFDVTLESEDGATNDTVTLAGTSPVLTTETFAGLDAVDLDDDPQGDVEVRTTGGTTLAVIRGAEFYGHGEGDEGVPALGTNGSHASAIGSTYETILDDTLERPQGTPLAHEINSVEFTVENDLEMREQLGTPRMAISVGNRTVEVAATVVGPTESVKNAEETLGAVSSNVEWSLDGGTLTAVDARLTDFGGVSKSEGEAAMSLDNTFTGETVDVTAN